MSPHNGNGHDPAILDRPLKDRLAGRVGCVVQHVQSEIEDATATLDRVRRQIQQAVEHVQTDIAEDYRTLGRLTTLLNSITPNPVPPDDSPAASLYAG
jgi:hypothetical protein